MMKKIILTLLTITALNFCFAQKKVESSVPSFEIIKLSGKIEATMQPSKEPGFSATITDGTQEMLDWKVNNGQLQIKLKQPMSIGSNALHPKAVIVIQYPEQLKEIIVDGNSTLTNEGKYEGKQLVINAMGGSTVALDVAVNDINITASTNSKVTITGSTEFVTVKANTGASVNTVAMDCENANAATATNAECYVTAKKRLEAKATTNSNIFYKGKPEILSVSNATLGKVEGF